MIEKENHKWDYPKTLGLPFRCCVNCGKKQRTVPIYEWETLNEGDNTCSIPELIPKKG